MSACGHIAGVTCDNCRLAYTPAPYVPDIITRVGIENARIEAIRQTIPCPTCGGDEWMLQPTIDGPVGAHCSDCPDGFISVERAWAIVAKVFKTYDVNDFGAEAWGHVRQFIDELRAVRP